MSNDTNQKFTGRERDLESGLDGFGARYYGSALGRFTSPDEAFADQDEHDPQSGICTATFGIIRFVTLTWTDGLVLQLKD